ncbi:hypothetical protein H6G89_05540 [Oscillatoria sp. FACHB-1407]|uniref:hypothetical protein n=1 Tax=Oscillatoria sp. FACHB-1407 TaxID=2692847 RepID=UPI001686839A|nr:hypothetical protein [Oscillatoria sp. FACHB-1407]MBD2460503.1 hypothetical protein [Oscillatoria sp. FACHB-1407]
MSWLPNLGSWVRAIALTVLMWGLQVGIGYVWQIIGIVIRWSPRLGFLVGVLMVLSPILLIAVVHHFSQGLLNQIDPQGRSPRQSQEPGLFPGLLSWWEGFYGWTVSLLSMLTSYLLLGIVLPSFSLTTLLYTPFTSGEFTLVMTSLVRVVIAAFLYHFEYAVQQSWLTGNSSD